MAKYRPIYIQIWKDPDFQELSPTNKLIFIYLCTNSSTSESGIYPITAKTIANETSVGLETVVEQLHNGLFKNILYDEINKIVFVKKFRKYNAGGKPDLIRRSIIQDCFCAPHSPLWREFIKEYPEFKQDIEIVVKGFSNGSQTLVAKSSLRVPNSYLKGNSTIKGVILEKSPFGEDTGKVFALLDKERGYKPTKRKGEAASIIRMLKAGYSPDQIMGTWRGLKQREFYQGKELFMMAVESQIGAMLKKIKPIQEPPGVKVVR